MDEQQHPRRRASDWDPDDHDILIELRRDVANLINRVDGKMGDLAVGVSSLRTETAGALTRLDERVLTIERWKLRVEGAGVAGRWAVATAFAAGGLLVGVVGLLLKMSGHL